MIAHDAFRRLAAWAIDGPLGADEEREVAMHRAGCDVCRAFADGLRADAIAISRPRQLVPTAALDRRVEAALYGAPRRGRLSPVAVLVILAIMLAAASAAIGVGSLLRDQLRRPVRPEVPAGWTSVLVTTRDLRITLPPYLSAAVSGGTLQANEDPAGNANWLGLIASGPSSTEQPQAGQSLESLLLFWVKGAPHGPHQTRNVSLPAGPAVELRVLVAEGTPDVTQVVLYAISTTDGVAVLMLTGPPQDFVVHGADLQLIPQLLETGPALTAALGPEPPGFELRLTPPAGWRQMAAPVQTPDVPAWTTFISNAAFPADMCRPQDDGTLVCGPVLTDGAPGVFVLGVLEIRGEVPRSPVDSPSLPPTVHHATVAGHPAIRTDRLVPEGGNVEFVWEVESPGEPTGVFVIRMIASANGYESILPQVEQMIGAAVFVAKGG